MKSGRVIEQVRAATDRSAPALHQPHLVDAGSQEGNRLGVDGTPFFFINGHAISGGVGLAEFKELTDAALKEAAGPNMTPVPGR